jgi:hypothetical protein
MGVATSIVRSASLRLWLRAKRSEGSYRTDEASAGSPTYHCVEKPCHDDLERPALNEKRTAMATGINDQMA